MFYISGPIQWPMMVSRLKGYLQHKMHDGLNPLARLTLAEKQPLIMKGAHIYGLKTQTLKRGVTTYSKKEKK